jgi:uncharacterized caspase-like protein
VTRAAFVLGSNGPERLGRLKCLTFARRDVARFAQAISTTAVGFSVTGRRLRVRDPVIKQFNELASSLGPRDELLFYFAGHGLVSHGDFYLVLDGTRSDRLPATALPWVNIKQIIRQSDARNKVVILDCCHAGEAVDDPLGGAFRGAFDSETIHAVARGSTASILVACGPDGFARETERRHGGVLTSLIVDALGSKRPGSRSVGSGVARKPA